MNILKSSNIGYLQYFFNILLILITIIVSGMPTKVYSESQNNLENRFFPNYYTTLLDHLPSTNSAIVPFLDKIMIGFGLEGRDYNAKFPYDSINPYFSTRLSALFPFGLTVDLEFAAHNMATSDVLLRPGTIYEVASVLFLSTHFGYGYKILDNLGIGINLSYFYQVSWQWINPGISLLWIINDNFILESMPYLFCLVKYGNDKDKQNFPKVSFSLPIKLGLSFFNNKLQLFLGHEILFGREPVTLESYGTNMVTKTLSSRISAGIEYWLSDGWAVHSLFLLNWIDTVFYKNLSGFMFCLGNLFNIKIDFLFERGNTYYQYGNIYGERIITQGLGFQIYLSFKF